MTDFNNYIDPLFLDKITYIDKDGNRRVKNPYRNRKSYDLIVQEVDDSGNFVWTVPEDIAGKSVFIEFPGKKIYSFMVNAVTREITVVKIPVMTYIIINVVNPNPLPPSEHDLYWDKIGYDAQKSILAAWGDIDLICNVLYPATAESELNFDDQNTLKYRLVGWKNNCGNFKGSDWGRPNAPQNGVYYPPQPEPHQPPPPDVGHDYDYKFLLRWEDNSTTDLDFYGYIDHDLNKRVYYSSKEYGSDENRMWLDRDYISHGSNGFNDQPETITVLGFKDSIVSIQINNYNSGPLSKNVVVEVMNIDQELIKTFTIPYYHLSGARKTFWVCDLDLGTGVLVDKMKEVELGNFN